ncbi:hypothetical protein LSTR_LSTR004015 [Laodelphax striatellus]|uniref:Peptidase M13 N-terminal domain-containing protein n=1 Tax=Laodelphax striatellus TaxID=195883 RepID=A0A482WFU3_LAOST|nr:hypothetical protein LSTR_LSTR004015 [Laodelphax striatellus]
MARGYYTVQHGSQYPCCKMWILASTVLVLFLLVQASILMTPYFMGEDTPTSDALENHPEISTISVITTDKETYYADTDITTKSTTFILNKWNTGSSSSTTVLSSNVEINTESEFDHLVFGKWNTSLDFENSTEILESRITDVDGDSTETWDSSNSTDFIDSKNSTVTVATFNENSTEILISSTKVNTSDVEGFTTVMNESYSTTTKMSHPISEDRETNSGEVFNGDESDSMESTETESCTEYNSSGEINKIDESRTLNELDLKRFYFNCVEHNNSDYKLRKDAGRKLITSIGRINNGFHPVNNLTNIIIFLIQMNSFPLFDVSLEIDKSNTSRLSLTVSPPLQDGISLFDVNNEKEKRCIEESTPERESSHSINLKDSYHSYRECKQNHTVYISAIQEALAEFELIDGSIDVESITDDMEKIITEIFESGPDSITLEKIKTSYKNEVLTVGALKDVFNGSVNWEELFNSIVNSSIDSNTEIHVYGLDYFKIIGTKLMIDSELWKVQNFLLANFAHNIFEYFFKVKSECNRESYCLEVASRLMPDVVTNLYLESFSKKELQQARKSFDLNKKYTAQFQCDKMLTGKARDTFSFNILTAQSMGFEQTYVEDGITYTFTPRGDLSIEERISDVSATFLALETLKYSNTTELTTLPWGDMTYQQVFFIAVAQSTAEYLGSHTEFTFCSKMSFFDSFPSLFEKKTLSSSYDGVLPPSLRCKEGSTMDATLKLDPFPFRTNEIDY